jgi:hypothetical protein
VAVAVALSLLAARVDAANAELFRIERNTNENYVRYDVRLRSDGSLDPKAPVTAYWILPSENGRREGLTWLEEKLAYGFSLKRSTDGLSLSLVAFEARSVAIRRVAASWRAEITIGGKRALLKRIWVQTTGTVLGPRVDWIELTGIDVRSNETVSERIINR